MAGENWMGHAYGEWNSERANKRSYRIEQSVTVFLALQDISVGSET